MFGFLKSLFSPVGQPLWIEAFDLDTTIKLPKPVTTSFRRKVTVVRVFVDVQYQVRDKQIVIKKVRLSRGRASWPSKNLINVVSVRTGEAWLAPELPISEADLRKVVEKEIEPRESNLRRMMFGKWIGVNGAADAKPVIDAINKRQTAAEIEALIKTAGRSHQISFTYDSPERGRETRSVILHGASGDSIRVTEIGETRMKTFRIDRITNARFERPPADHDEA